MTIPQRILLQVTVAAGLMIAVATSVTYGIAYQAAKDRDLDHLETYVRERARREELGFQQVQANLALVRGQFLKRIASPIPGNYEAQWNDRFQLYPDGAWRSRTNFTDGRKYSTLWAHKRVVFTPELKTQVLRAQNICDDLLPGWADGFPSVYFIFPGWLNIGFDPRLPNWVWDTPADYDPGALEWFQLAMQTNRPAGGIAWSGVIEEPTTKVPIVSVYLPIERDGKFLGSVGHDLFVSRLMDETTRSDLPGSMHVIFRRDGRLVVHPTKQREILGSKGQFRMQDGGDPALASLYRAVSGRAERRFSGFDPGSGLYFSGARLAGPEWIFLTTVPRELLRQLAFQSAQWVLWSGLASLALLLGFLAATLRRQIARPLAELTRATRQMSGGDVSAQADVGRRDELGALAGAFNEMARRVAQRDAELQAEKAALERRVAERTAELRGSEARLSTVFQNSPAMQSVLRRADDVIVEVNDAFLSKLGYTREEVTGKSPFELNTHEDKANLIAFRQKLHEHGFVQDYEIPLRARDGRLVTVLLSTYPVSIGGVPHLVSAGVDITARKEAEARTRALYESLSAAVVVQDETGFLQINSASLKLFGADRAEEILGNHPANFSAPLQPDGEDSVVAARRHMDRALTHGVERFEWLARRLDGTEFPVEVTLTAVQLEGRPVVQAVIIDLTERRRAEAELQNALAKERELSQLKSEFVSLVSHEFRTPLEIILSSADNMQRYHDRLEPEKRDQLLRTIHKSVRRMSGMMEEVLVLGRLETDRMTFTPAPLHLPSLCRRICDEIDSATGQRCVIDLQTHCIPELAQGDESLLRHIFGNLLSNAVKYSPERARVEFNVCRAGDDAVCRITDRGCGIPAADQKRLFQAFHRGSNVRQVSGTGLGLLIVQRCVTLHGGEIQFESAEGQGTTFTVRLPLFTQPTPNL